MDKYVKNEKKNTKIDCHLVKDNDQDGALPLVLDKFLWSENNAANRIEILNFKNCFLTPQN